MKATQLEKALRECPVIAPEFELVRKPDWSRTTFPLEPGARLFAIGGSFHPADWNGASLSLGASYVKFIGYRDISGWLKDRQLVVSATMM